jgi:SAM-dependent methyltransferase
VSESASYYEPAFFEWQADRAERSARVVVPRLLELTHARSVIDLGCGTGAWLQVFRDHGVEDVLGIDGPYIDREQLRIPEELFVAADLSSPPAVGRHFDLALTLEAVHCAPEASATVIVQALVSYAPVVYFSSAVPSQGGGPGPNRQWPGYWAELFAREGFDCYDVLRRELWEHPHVDWWYAQNGLIFARAGTLGALEPTGPPLPLVHPLLLAHVVEHGAEDEGEEEAAEVRPSGWLSRLRGRAS